MIAALPGRSDAASISGEVLGPSGPVANMEARLWIEGPKGYALKAIQRTSATGVFVFATVEEGRYKLDTRMPPGMAGNYGDRWYDVDPPTSGGYIAEDADVIEVAADTGDLTGFTITVEVFGGLDGRVLDPLGTPLALQRVRAEWKGDDRYHHNDVTKGNEFVGSPHWGRFYMRGLAPHADYRTLVYDPYGRFLLNVIAGPFAVATGGVANTGDIRMVAAPSDPNEPNNAADQSTWIDSAGLHEATPQPWASTGAAIYPLGGGDVDWYCLEVQAGDRLIAEALTTRDIEGTARPHPWLDPVLSFWSGDGATKIAEDDDSGVGYQSRLDTGELLTAGTYCFAVTTYGDVDWTGLLQQTAGGYTFGLSMGNRRPLLTVLEGGTPAQTVTIAEGDTVVFDLTFSDPDGDTVAPTVVHLDTAGTGLTGGVLDLQAGTGSYTWTADDVAARTSPYALRFAVDDGEFEAAVEVVLNVSGVNIAPTAPRPRLPADGTVVITTTPTLVWVNGTDQDSDPLSYEVEVYYGNPATTAADQTTTVPEDASGQTGWTTAAIPENTTASWRVRAFDGQADNAYSVWSEFFTLRVDTTDDAPAVPELVKPEEGALITLRRPALSATNPVDPEGDAVRLHFEIATDPNFQNLVTESPAVPAQNAPTTAWTTDVDLDWGTQYFARARASDPAGHQSGYSNINGFRLKLNDLPAVPVFTDPFGAACANQELSAAPDQFRIETVVEPDGEPVRIELQIFNYADDPATAAPVFQETVQQAIGSAVTVIRVDPALFTAGGRYRVRLRALDPSAATEWVECDFTIRSGGGGGTDGGTTGDGGTDTPTGEQGCGCGALGGGSAVLPVGLALLALLRRRRR